MALWEKITVGGVEYKLDHINNFPLAVPSQIVEGKVYRVWVELSCHTFTKKWITTQHTEDMRVQEGNETRCFCPHRHLLSLLLPKIVQSAVGWKAYFSNQGNYMLVEDIPDADAPYVIYFDIMKATKSHMGYDVVMQIRSAHPKPALPKMLPVIVFKKLVEMTAAGQKPVRPRPVVRKRK